MGRCKKFNENIKPFCYYCDREFPSLSVLYHHQKVKHFKCHICDKGLDRASGLVTHMVQVHKETIFYVPNALKGRDSFDIDIKGMTNVPIDIIERRRETLRQAFNQRKSQKVKKTKNSLTQELIKYAQHHPRFHEFKVLLNKKSMQFNNNKVPLLFSAAPQQQTRLVKEELIYPAKDKVSVEEKRAQHYFNYTPNTYTN